MKTVVFACVHNAGRSQMAAAFFNARVQPGVAHAISAGTSPAERVHPEVVSVMHERGLDLSAAQPQRLTDDLARGAQWLITMGCGDACPFVPGLQRDDWKLEDPKGQSADAVRAIRDTIEVRVGALLAREGWALNETIRPAAAGDLPQVREVLREYQRAIGVDLCFQGFEAELAALPGDYAPPDGQLLIACCGGVIAGCVAVRRLADGACEMKRLYVRPAYEGRKLGRRLVAVLIDEARSRGYRAMRLDTLPSMQKATALYGSLGFRPIGAYTSNAIAGTLFFELPLS